MHPARLPGNARTSCAAKDDLCSPRCIAQEAPPLPIGSDDPARRPHPPHRLPLRPRNIDGAPGHPPAAGAALPHADPELLAQRSSRRRTSSTGSRIRSATICARVVFPEKTDRFVVTVDLVADMAVINPFDFFVEDEAKEWPFAYEPVLKQELAPYLEPCQSGRASRHSSPTIDRKKAVTIDFLVDLNQRLAAEVRYVIRMEPGVQTPRRRWRRLGLVPRLRLAAGADPAQPRLRRALRVGLPDPAPPDVKPLDGPDGRDRPTSPTCTPGPRSTCRAPAGSGSIRPPACSPARATSRSRRRRSRRAPRPSAARTSRPRWRSHSTCGSSASARPRASRKPYSDEQWGKVARGRRRRRRPARTPATCA